LASAGLVKKTSCYNVSRQGNSSIYFSLGKSA
jgi:hypothetical protein